VSFSLNDPVKTSLPDDTEATIFGNKSFKNGTDVLA
jgi:hypothetical protein